VTLQHEGPRTPAEGADSITRSRKGKGAMPTEFSPGDVVVFNDEKWGGAVGVVSQPIGDQSSGHVLTLRNGFLVGVSVAIHDVRAADKTNAGFAQLAYGLIKLGSHVIEERLLVTHR
jgi:hypothetical protein